MTHKKLVRTMSIQEMNDWLAYDICKTDEYKEKIEQERLSKLDAQGESFEMTKLFGGMRWPM